jgi:hypothetical protein
MKIQIFHHPKIQSSKKFSKRKPNPSRYYDSVTNLDFQHKSKYQTKSNTDTKAPYFYIF